MVSTSVLVTSILAGFGSVVTLVLALVRNLGSQMSEISAQLLHVDRAVSERLDRHEARLSERSDRHEAMLVKVSDDLTALRAAVAGLDARVATLERR